MAYARTGIQSDSGWSHQMDDLSYVLTPRNSSSANSSFDLPSPPNAQSVAVIRQLGNRGTHCWAYWDSWKLPPTVVKWVSTSKHHIEKERVVNINTTKLNYENAIHQRASTIALPGDSSELSLSTANPSPIVTAVIYIFTDPA
ncbi:hypothetical protein N7463_003253 [Penicillium fimorum]|uniref:Uncharacterized protein n=1 Tax=Penicillium fimorum TaxID=1882269 RepID=A0A9W9Y0S7_9EURO|nr:hypothetical protein N7463_003253 [Penicillium fimorum]